ncbi:MAG: manganese efflux pump MntP family protein [Rikenellaceae bacterium]|jgi:putative Mn2+ efflux pump MntP|nr:manganese efflux pump MntP family protein [Rikenellaceae bacterium]
MNLLTFILLAIGLCFDSFAVSLSAGMTTDTATHHRIFVRFALILGVFQGAMLLAGWAGGRGISNLINAFDHWIAFGLLALIGVNMIRSSFRKEECPVNPFCFRRNCLLGIATSIDAVITGVALGLVTLTLVPHVTQTANMIVGAVIMAAVTFTASLIGVFIGHMAGNKLGSRAELIGGIVLILIGAKVLFEHLTA